MLVGPGSVSVSAGEGGAMYLIDPILASLLIWMHFSISGVSIFLLKTMPFTKQSLAFLDICCCMPLNSSSATGTFLGCSWQLNRADLDSCLELL